MRIDALRNRVAERRDRLLATYWFVPAVMAASAFLLAQVTQAIDRTVVYGSAEALWWLYSGSPEGARAILSTIAGSMITVAGVTFSVTIVALVMASSQFGPRILGSFMRDRGNQVVLGTFLATFLFCIASLQSVRSTSGSEFVPRISVTVGFALAIASIGVLIYFIDHVATSIQAPQVVRRIGRAVDRTLDEVFPEELPERHGSVHQAERDARRSAGADRQGEAERATIDANVGGAGEESRPEGRPVRVQERGYLQAVDEEALLSVAVDADVCLELRCRVGDYLIVGSDLVAGEPADRMVEELDERIRDAFTLGDYRTEKQDAEFVIDRLVEIATRALSPSLNDPYTALNCIDRLSGALGRVLRRPAPSTRVQDEDGTVRVRMSPISFPNLIFIAFDRIREYGAEHTSVLVRLLEAISGLARVAGRESDLTALEEQADRVLRAGRRNLEDEPDLEELVDRHRRVLRAIQETREGPGRLTGATGEHGGVETDAS